MWPAVLWGGQFFGLVVIDVCPWCELRVGGFDGSRWCEPCTREVVALQERELGSCRQERLVVSGVVLRLVDDCLDWWGV